MKKYTLTFVLTCILSFSSVILFAQDPPPPLPPANHGNDGDSRGAPIDGGLGILLAMGAAYGGYKGYKFYREKKKEAPE